MAYDFEKKDKRCIIHNETLGGLTLGLISAGFYPLDVSTHSIEDEYLLKENIPSLNLNLNLNPIGAEDEVDLFASHINQIDNDNWEEETEKLEYILNNTNYKNYFLASNSGYVQLKQDVGYKDIGKILEKKNLYVQVARTYYRAYGGSEFRTNAFILGTECPTLSYKFKRTSINFSAPATADYLAALKDRNGFPKDWKLDVLRDNDSFLDQIRRLEKCVFPQLVKMMAETMLIL